jgi:hypothetical protein
VIFVAHAGLDTITSIGDVWRRFPVDQVIRAKWWRVPFDEVPRAADHEAQLQWLYGWWQRIDRWITENRPDGARAPAVVPPPESGACELPSPMGAVLVEALHLAGHEFLPRWPAAEVQ